MNTHLTLGFSPCPNDTFMFDALVHGKVDTEGLIFEVVLDDVEGLNQRAFSEKLHITKLSYHALMHCADKYNLLSSGSALGRNCGPLLITTPDRVQNPVEAMQIAIPGKYTTANMLLSVAFPAAINKQEYVFSAIENAVLSGEVDAGLLIHENRFTYEERGLCKLFDLGEFWEEETGLPIPLGGIVAHHKLPLATQQKVARVLQRSVAYAFACPASSRAYVRTHAQAMDEEVMQAHIGLYVNSFSEDLGEEGRQAIETLFARAGAKPPQIITGL